jgi:hypothetical protein
MEVTRMKRKYAAMLSVTAGVALLAALGYYFLRRPEDEADAAGLAESDKKVRAMLKKGKPSEADLRTFAAMVQEAGGPQKLHEVVYSDTAMELAALLEKRPALKDSAHFKGWDKVNKLALWWNLKPRPSGATP